MKDENKRLAIILTILSLLLIILLIGISIGSSFTSLFSFIELISNSRYNDANYIISQVNIDRAFLKVKPGEIILAQITLVQIGDRERRDVKVKYYVSGEKNIGLVSGEETVALEGQASIVAKLNIPEKTKSGDYIFIAHITDLKTDEILSHSSKSFFIEGLTFLEKISMRDLSLISLYTTTLFFIVFSVMVLINIRKLSQKHKTNHEIDISKLKKFLHMKR